MSWHRQHAFPEKRNIAETSCLQSAPSWCRRRSMWQPDTCRLQTAIGLPLRQRAPKPKKTWDGECCACIGSDDGDGSWDNNIGCRFAVLPSGSWWEEGDGAMHTMEQEEGRGTGGCTDAPLVFLLPTWCLQRCTEQVGGRRAAVRFLGWCVRGHDHWPTGTPSKRALAPPRTGIHVGNHLVCDAADVRPDARHALKISTCPLSTVRGLPSRGQVHVGGAPLKVARRKQHLWLTPHPREHDRRCLLEKWTVDAFKMPGHTFVTPRRPKSVHCQSHGNSWAENWTGNDLERRWKLIRRRRLLQVERLKSGSGGSRSRVSCFGNTGRGHTSTLLGREGCSGISRVARRCFQPFDCLGVLCFWLCPSRPLSPRSVGPLWCVYSWICCTLGISCNLTTANFLVGPLQLHFSRARACRIALPLCLQLSGRVASALPRHLTMLTFLRMFFLDDCSVSSLDRACLPHHPVAVAFELPFSVRAAQQVTCACTLLLRVWLPPLGNWPALFWALGGLCCLATACTGAFRVPVVQGKCVSEMYVRYMCMVLYPPRKGVQYAQNTVDIRIFVSLPKFCTSPLKIDCPIPCEMTISNSMCLGCEQSQFKGGLSEKGLKQKVGAQKRRACREAHGIQIAGITLFIFSTSTLPSTHLLSCCWIVSVHDTVGFLYTSVSSSH